jgi:hypothetical protein
VVDREGNLSSCPLDVIDKLKGFETDVVGGQPVHLTDKHTWAIDVNTMTQVNDTMGTARKIRRIIMVMD